MAYRSVPGAIAKGHLLGLFADNPGLKIGPRPDMPKTMTACPKNDNPTPFCVIEVRYRKGMAMSSDVRSGSTPDVAVQAI